MSKKLYAIFAAVLMASMLLAACGQAAPAPTEAPATEAPATEAPATEAPTEAPKPMKICQITDTGGIDDKSFNATAWKGVTDAQAEFGIEGKYLESTQAADYEKNINAFVEEGCDLIVTVGFLLGDATKAGAEANPDVKFTIVDYAYDPTLPNVIGQVFNTDEAAFLAGYLAAGMTKTGKVGTFGGLQIPPVTVFMDGYFYGVKYYNEKKGTNVEVLGWDPVAATGLFTQSFDDQNLGKQFAIQLMDNGADVVMPVAGPVGIGSAAAIKERTTAEAPIFFIGVDSDWFETQPDYGDIILTSVLKKMDATTKAVIKKVIDGAFEGGLEVGSLSNGGVDLAPYHNFDSVVPAELKAEIEQLKADIISGAVKVKP